MSKLMIVAHPDDETIFGGQEILTGEDWNVICLTNRTSIVRAKEFEMACNRLGAEFEMYGFPDRWEGFTEVELGTIRSLIIDYMNYGDWEYVVTHNADGEYGHIQHQQIHKIVTEIAGKHGIEVRVFGLSDTIEIDVVEKKLNVLSAYSSRTQGFFDLTKYILYGTVVPYTSLGNFDILYREEIDSAYDNLIPMLKPEERAISGFGMCPKEDWVEAVGDLADRRLVYGYRTSSGEIAGLCYLKESQLDERSFTTSIIIGKKHRGCGIGTLLKNFAIEQAFVTFDAKSVFDTIDAENVSSIKVSLNCGMRIVSAGKLRRGAGTKVILRRDNPRWK